MQRLEGLMELVYQSLRRLIDGQRKLIFGYA